MWRQFSTWWLLGQVAAPCGRGPLSSRARRLDEHPVAAPESGECENLMRYGDGVPTLALETYGRMGPRSMEALQLAAREAALYCTAALRPGTLQRRWRQDIHLALAFAQADAVLVAKGALPRAFGPSFPIGRVRRRRSVVAGEQRELLAASG